MPLPDSGLVPESVHAVRAHARKPRNPGRDRTNTALMTSSTSATFAHERLDVYRAATEYLARSEQIASALPTGRRYLSEQLRRASLSICLNIAEGAGEFAPLDKARFYRMARRSGTECVAILDACRTLGLVDATWLAEGRAILHRVVSMLTVLVLRLSKAESESEGDGTRIACTDEGTKPESGRGRGRGRFTGSESEG
jgi:four helix bundle protein